MIPRSAFTLSLVLAALALGACSDNDPARPGTVAFRPDETRTTQTLRGFSAAVAPRQSSASPAEITVLRSEDYFVISSRVRNTGATCRFPVISVHSGGRNSSSTILFGHGTRDGSVIVRRQFTLNVLARDEATFVSYRSECGSAGGSFGAQAFLKSISQLGDSESVTLPALYVDNPSEPRTPSVRWYFDEDLTQTSADCDGTTNNFAYIVAENFDAAFTSVEYKVAYPPSGDVQWITEIGVNPWQLNVGVTPLGVISEWSRPINGYSPVVIMKVLYSWVSCGNCNPAANSNQPLVIQPHPDSGRLSFVRASGERIDAVGRTSLVCPSSIFAVEQTTWGKVKALYR